ncbi:hypothetical protein QAD02_021410 [Eretmocerus hayati]|uniref:Uncharacterized protein n=1 Tax=Eretmocerus hayati TaxID=131215 RepID=A0ACC2PTC5_9HYME|nr:hypothetical protein QAD02_021410 [Eretmocerus hayati]
MVRHGGCLGLGLAAMGSHRQDVYEQLKFNLYQDDAVTGEAAGIAMGMVMLGSKSNQAIEDMVACIILDDSEVIILPQCEPVRVDYVLNSACHPQILLNAFHAFDESIIEENAACRYV